MHVYLPYITQYRYTLLNEVQMDLDGLK